MQLPQKWHAGRAGDTDRAAHLANQARARCTDPATVELQNARVIVVSLIGCYYGLKTTGGTQGVGRATTQAMVSASVLIFVLTYLIAQVFVSQTKL